MKKIIESDAFLKFRLCCSRSTECTINQGMLLSFTASIVPIPLDMVQTIFKRWSDSPSSLVLSSISDPVYNYPSDPFFTEYNLQSSKGCLLMVQLIQAVRCTYRRYSNQWVNDCIERWREKLSRMLSIWYMNGPEPRGKARIWGGGIKRGRSKAPDRDRPDRGTGISLRNGILSEEWHSCDSS